MKRFGIILGIFLTCLLIIFISGTSFVKRKSFYQEEYYKRTNTLLDSIKSVFVCGYDSIWAGFSKVSITPSLHNASEDFSTGNFSEVPLAGYGARKGKGATDIHDSIFVKAVALKLHKTKLVLVSADLLIMPPNIIDSVTALLSREGIQRSQLFFSATHTHSSLGGWGSGFIGEQFAGKENKNLQKWLVIQIRKAITSALSDLSPAQIGCGTFDAASYTRNRVMGESGTKNDEFSFIVIEQKGRKKAIIGSFSAHSTTLGSENMEISADYPGYWERRIEATSADIALFFAGSTGSQSPVGEGKGFEKTKSIGEALADSLNVHLPQVVLRDKIRLSSVSLKVQLPEFHIRLTTKINLSSYLSNKLLPQHDNVYLQALRIDNMIWITTPSDFSGEYALEIKNALAAKKFNSNVTSFNGSYVGYIVPGRYFYLNEYESKLMGWFGPEMGEYTMYLIRRIIGIMIDSDKIL
jgi:neutral ceramidase